MIFDKELLKLWNKFESTGNVNDYLKFARVSHGEISETEVVSGDGAAELKFEETADDN